MLKQLVQFVLRNAALVLALGLISRLPIFRKLFYQSVEQSKARIWFTSYWAIAALLATQISFGSAYVPFLAGRYGGVLPGATVGLFSGGWLLINDTSMPAVVVHVLAGGLGGLLQSRLALGKASPGWVALLAGFLSLLGLDHPESPGGWVPAEMLGNGLQGLLPMAYLSAAFGVADLLFIRMMEYLMMEGERHHAQTSVRMLELAEETSSTLAGGLNDAVAAKLAVQIREELELPGVCIAKMGRVLAFDGNCAHLSLADNDLPLSGIHTEVFAACPPGCPYQEIEVLPIGTGGAWIGLLGGSSRPLGSGVRRSAKALAAVLTGMLARTRDLEQKAELEEARHRFLQAQIRPHFLFNTLNTIASVAQDEQTRELVLDLATFLRESFRRDSALVSLERELEVVECYLSIEKKRFGERLNVELDMPSPLPRCLLPSFSLQPLVENAVHHGIGVLADGGTVTIKVKTSAEQVEVSVEDTGPGIPDSVLEKLARGEYQNSQIGISNVKQRLEANLGSACQFQVKGSRISFRVPLEDEQ